MNELQIDSAMTEAHNARRPYSRLRTRTTLWMGWLERLVF